MFRRTSALPFSCQALVAPAPSSNCRVTPLARPAEEKLQKARKKGLRRAGRVSGGVSGSDQRGAVCVAVGLSVSDARDAKHLAFSATRVPHTNSLPPSLTRPASRQPRVGPSGCHSFPTSST